MQKNICDKILFFDLKKVEFFFHIFLGLQRVVGEEAERKEVGENKSHFLMLSRRAAVLYCVA